MSEIKEVYLDAKTLGDPHVERLRVAMREAKEFLVGLQKREASIKADDLPALIAKSRIVIQRLVDCATVPATLSHLTAEAAAATRADLIRLGDTMQNRVTACLSLAWSELERKAAAETVEQAPSKAH
jgi:hypothetical protein